MLDPTKLLASAVRHYRNDMDRLFGAFLPVPQSNLEILNGDETISLGELSLDVVYTPGHASHHVTYFLPQQRIAFVGDTAGVSINGDTFVLPATPPPDINIELWDASLDSISRLHAHRLFLTHFGFSDHPESHIANYRKRLHMWSDIAGNILQQPLDDSSALKSFLQQVTVEASTL